MNSTEEMAPGLKLLPLHVCVNKWTHHRSGTRMNICTYANPHGRRKSDAGFSSSLDSASWVRMWVTCVPMLSLHSAISNRVQPALVKQDFSFSFFQGDDILRENDQDYRDECKHCGVWLSQKLSQGKQKQRSGRKGRQRPCPSKLRHKQPVSHRSLWGAAPSCRGIPYPKTLLYGGGTSRFHKNNQESILYY